MDRGVSVVVVSLETGAGRVQRFGGVVSVGRDPGCDLVLEARGVSAVHCRIHPVPERAGACRLEDLASTYGTVVNGARVGEPVVVSSDDVIAVGAVRLVVCGPGEEASARARLERHALEARARAARRPRPRSRRAAGQLAAFNPQTPWPQQFAQVDGLARAWHAAGRPHHKLLAGPVVAVAEQWLATGAGKRPSPRALHREFIERSRHRRSRGVRAAALAGVGCLILVVAVAAAVSLRHDLERAFAAPQLALEETVADETGRPASTPPDLQVLVERAGAEPDGARRLLLQAAVAKVARSRGTPLLSAELWPLQVSAHRTLGAFKETELTGHTGPIRAVRFSPGGMHIASASEDGSARLWDFTAPPLTRPRVLRGHLGALSALQFAADGTRLATAGEDGKVWLWNTAAQDPAATGRPLVQHESAVRVLAWDPHGLRLATGDDEGILALWDLRGPEPVPQRRRAHDGPITALAFGALEGPCLVSGSDDRTARIWDLPMDGSLSSRRVLDAHIGGLRAVGVSGDGRWVATGSTAGELLLWPQVPPARWRSRGRAYRGKPLSLAGHREGIAALAFTEDSRWLLSAGDGVLRMWDLSAPDPSLTSTVLSGHTGDIEALEVAAGGRAVSGSSDTSLWVWDLKRASRGQEAGHVLGGHNASVGAVAVAPDGSRVVSGAEDGSVRVWDAHGRSGGRGGATLRLGAAAVQDVAVAAGMVLAVSSHRAQVWDRRGRARWRMPRRLGAQARDFKSSAIDAHGRWAAAGTEGGEIFVWPLAERTAEPARLRAHQGPVNALAFLRDGRLVSVGSDRLVCIWNLRTLQPDHLGSGHPDEVHALAVSPDGRYVFTGGLDGTLMRWTVSDGTATPLVGHEKEILALSVAPDGRRVASGSTDRRARVWDVETGASLVLRGHEGPVHAVAFSRDEILATGGGDRQIRLWDLASAHPDEAPRVLAGHEQSVTSLAFSRDSTVLASGSNDTSVRLWRVDTGDSLVLAGHDRVVSKLVLAEDANELVSASFDGSVRVWPMGQAAFARRVCDVVGRSLEPTEAAAALGVHVPDPCAGPQATIGRR